MEKSVRRSVIKNRERGRDWEREENLVENGNSLPWVGLEYVQVGGAEGGDVRVQVERVLAVWPYKCERSVNWEKSDRIRISFPQ